MRRFLRVGHLLIFLAPVALAQIAPVAQRVQPDQGDATSERPEPSPPPIAVATPIPTPVPPRPMHRLPPAANPTPVSAANPTSPGGDMVKLQFPNSDVDDVLRLYEQLTGKKLVRDNFVQGKVNIFIAKDVPKEEAIKIIEMNLLMNGFSLVPADEDIVKVIGTGKNPRTTGVPIISDPAQIPEGDHVISFLFKLRYADPTELQQVLGQYLQPPQIYTSFLALPKSSSLLITENSSVIRTISKIIDQVDIPPAEVVSEFVPLLRADAQKVVDMLKDIFEKGTQQTQGSVPGQPPGVRGVRQAAVPQAPGGDNDIGSLTALSEDSVVVGKIKLSADVRTNRIHVITRPINMPFIRKLIAEFDANVEFAKPVTRALRYISAGDVLPVLVQSLTEPGTQQQNGQDQTAGAQNRNQQNQRPGTSTNNQAGSSSSTASSASDTGSLNVSEELSTTPVDTTPKAVTVGNAKIIADQRANTIIVLGNREVVVKVEKILDEMDVKAPQVALSTVIGELTLSNDEEFGVDYFAKYKNKVVGISRNTSAPIPAPLSSATPLPSGSLPPTTGGILDPSQLVNFGNALQQVTNGTNVYVAAGNYLSTIVHLLESTGRFKTVSRPTVFTSNNKKAIIASGQEIPVPVSTLTNATSTINTTGVASVASNIEYKKVALQLEVVPLINSEKEVSLDILQKIDSLGTSTVIDGNSIPTVNTRYIRTNVTAANGCTIVLGGLIQDAKTKDTTGVPLIDRIPLIGGLFRSTTATKMRTELIILMRPEVTLTQLDLFRLRQKQEEHTHFGPEIDETDCPDCPTPGGGGDAKQVSTSTGKELPAPDLPATRNY